VSEAERSASQFEARLTEATAGLEAAKAKLAELETQADEARQRAREQEAAAREKLAELEAQADEARQREAAAQEKLAELEARANEAERQAREREAAVQAKLAELESKAGETERLAREREAAALAIQEQFAKLEADKGVLVSERERLSSDLAVARAARIRLEGRVTALEAASAEAVKFLDAERAEKAKQAQAAEALGAKLQALEGERAALREKIKQLEARKPVSDSEAVLEMSEELERVQGALEALQATLAERDAEIVEHKRRLESQESEMAALKRMAARAGSNTVQDIYARANAEINAVKNELLRRPKGSTPASPAGSPAPEAAPSTPKTDEQG
jgi:chromosome segregation ATPase